MSALEERAATTSGRPAPDAPDLDLLRAFEPIVRYTEGELFFPSAVEPYLRECDLWVGRSERDRRLLVPRGGVSAGTLGSYAPPPGTSLFLRLVQEPLDPIAMARWNRRPDRTAFRAPGRLARVGLFARLIDAGFSAALLLRGTVPGGTTAAAWHKYGSARLSDARSVYHGRVVRSGDWIVLHYLWFYFMNDWRSTFQGANDHEGDWEQAFVFLEATPEAVRPVWFACAAHERSGDDARRRWDDPQLVREGDHPVIFAGAGSHASYLERGDYLTSVALPAQRVVGGILEALRRFWRDTLRQDDPAELTRSATAALSVPFVDYARGDGRAIGPGQPDGWSPVLIDDETPWIAYRGLFGLDTHDRFAGERAPAGPKWSRDGFVRRTWHDPVGWAGLAKVAPPSRAADALRERIADLQRDLDDERAAEAELAADLPGLELEVRALGSSESFDALYDARREELVRREGELLASRRRQAELLDELGVSRGALRRAEAGDPGDPRAHLRRAVRPVPAEATHHGRLVELWSAVSIGVVLVGIVGAIATDVLDPVAAVAVALGLSVAIEAAFRRRLGELMLRTTLVLAVAGSAILLYQELTSAVVVAILALALFSLADNVREIAQG